MLCRRVQANGPDPAISRTCLTGSPARRVDDATLWSGPTRSSAPSSSRSPAGTRARNTDGSRPGPRRQPLPGVTFRLAGVARRVALRSGSSKECAVATGVSRASGWSATRSRAGHPAGRAGRWAASGWERRATCSCGPTRSWRSRWGRRGCGPSAGPDRRCGWPGRRARPLGEGGQLSCETVERLVAGPGLRTGHGRHLPASVGPGFPLGRPRGCDRPRGERCQQKR
jgi:hypothetical protein